MALVIKTKQDGHWDQLNRGESMIRPRPQRCFEFMIIRGL